MVVDIYVGNIPFEATEEDVRKLFEVAGKVRSIHLITDHISGKFKGCGFVKMADVKARVVIDTLDGALLINRQIEVSEARPQKPGDSKPAGNRGRKPGSSSNKPPRKPR
ncbi:RNA recognition motif domain-containing protein [Trichloromonas sp.]|uniref:RNA recognition motif domain-containing protein n=1 Tax=Trichloromonas sp. TaxID=3069249 RepID=UPI003D8186CF